MLVNLICKSWIVNDLAIIISIISRIVINGLFKVGEDLRGEKVGALFFGKQRRNNGAGKGV